MTPNNKMNVVLDTNVFLAILPAHSPYHIVYKALYQNKINAIISRDILLEYEEQFAIRYGSSIATNIVEGLIENKKIICQPTYNFNLIYQDADDNKFVDCAIAGNGDYIVTNNKHFNIRNQ